MFLVDWRIKGVPATFLAVLVVMVLLTIFFGAWAISTDLDARDGSLPFGVVGGAPGFGVTSPKPSSGADKAIPTEQVVDVSKSDSWWGKVVLKACPLH